MIRCFASLQPFLAKTYGLTPATTGLFFLLFGATYTTFTPVFGWLMDKEVLDGFTALVLGNLGISLAHIRVGNAGASGRECSALAGGTFASRQASFTSFFNKEIKLQRSGRRA